MGTRRPFSARNKGQIQGFGTQVSTDISYALLKNARHSGQLNLSNRDLEDIPEKVWRINIDVPEEAKDVSLDFDGERWWDQVDLKKLILASNKLTALSGEIKNFPALTVLDAHDNKIEHLPEELGDLQELTRMNLSHNSLCELPVSFHCLRSLQTLLLSGNKLETLPDTFGDLKNLDELDLSQNHLPSLPLSFGNLAKLRKLNLSANRLQRIPEEIGKLTELHDLNISNNHLQELPSGIQYMRSLEILDCKFNKISSFPELRSKMSLKELYLGNNKLTELVPDSLDSLSTLIIFDVRDNRITALPPKITCLAVLERLDLTNNNVSGLPCEMGLMPLKSLVLDGNPLRSLRRDVVSKGTQAILDYLRSRMPAKEEVRVTDESKQTQPAAQPLATEDQIILPTKSLNYSAKQATTIHDQVWLSGKDVNCLNFSKNALTELPLKMLDFASTLVELDLSGNRISKIPDEVGQLRRLTDVDLSNNCLSQLPETCQEWQHLITITLANNRFTQVPPVLYKIGNICNILISNNQIGSIDVNGLLQLKKLQALDLTNNNIGQVPPELGNVSWLRSLHLVGNPFRNPRAALLDKGTQFLLGYLRDRIPT